MEIERKFLVRSLPDLRMCRRKEIEQFYISTVPEIRARRAGANCFLTIKRGSGLVREEYEIPLSLNEFNALRSKMVGKVVQKVRYYLDMSSGLVIELDVFKGELTPLSLVEVEFKSEEDAKAFIPPDWFGVDVTDNEAYKNKNLAFRQRKVKENEQGGTQGGTEGEQITEQTAVADSGTDAEGTKDA